MDWMKLGQWYQQRGNQEKARRSFEAALDEKMAILTPTRQEYQDDSELDGEVELHHDEAKKMAKKSPH